MNRRTPRLAALLSLLCLLSPLAALAWTPLPVKDDPLVRMPGTQPDQGVRLEGAGRCLNCHAGYNKGVEPGYNWRGSMMAQAARDFLYWSCLTVSAQDSIWAVGRPNGTDLCLRCHMGSGWLQGRSDPTNGSAMIGDDFDGVQCDFCHALWDPFYENTYRGTREGSDWTSYWDETNRSSTPSSPAATTTYNEDRLLSPALKYFNGTSFYGSNNQPDGGSYVEAGAGQYYASGSGDKRASFADAQARHRMLYSRYHKSRYFCSACHDVSNPILQNLAQKDVRPGTGTTPLPTESASAHSYYHVERTFSEFMLSDYGRQGGAPGIGPFDPSKFETSHPGNYVASCQDCHMRDVVGAGCNKAGVPVRPTDSVEHPQSGQPLHDQTGGNAWVSWVLASAVAGSPNYDQRNRDLLHQGPAVLTLDMTQGLGVDPAALLSGVGRAKDQLRLAAAIQNLSYTPSTGALSFRVQNQTGHKLISGFPEGRRMYLNVRAYDGAGALIHEVNPYDATAGTLKGLPSDYSPNSPALGPNEAHRDDLVYEMHPESSLTGEEQTFHFVLADGRSKDNRIPPKGFRIADAAARLSVPVWHGVEDPDLYTSAEYAGGHDDVSLAVPAGAAGVRVTLYYQTTSREYVEFLRDEIKGTPGARTLPDSAYIAQTDPFFAKLKAWGTTIWDLWSHNKDVAGAAPYRMAEGVWGSVPLECSLPDPTLLSAVPGSKKVTLTWSDEHSLEPDVAGYRIYYDQAGKSQLRAAVGRTTTYTDTGLTNGQTYCYKVTSVTEAGCESAYSNVRCATPTQGGGGKK